MDDGGAVKRGKAGIRHVEQRSKGNLTKGW